jgi:hypothetical protein
MNEDDVELLEYISEKAFEIGYNLVIENDLYVLVDFYDDSNEHEFDDLESVDSYLNDIS